MKTTNYIQRRLPRWRDLPIDLISGDLISGSPIAHWAPIPLRLIVGYGFMEHGVAKLARGLDAFPAILQALGVPAPHFMGWLTILVELFGGLAVLLGAQFGPPGFETDLLYLACLAALVLGGSGPLAIDGLLAKRGEGERS
jgi:putative oxidoreductase